MQDNMTDAKEAREITDDFYVNASDGEIAIICGDIRKAAKAGDNSIAAPSGMHKTVSTKLGTMGYTLKYHEGYGQREPAYWSISW